MSTDTAFALGMLALVGPRFPDRLRAFMLTVVVVDDVVALVVIATVYTDHRRDAAARCRPRPVRSRARRRARRSVRRGLVYAALGGAMWVALLKSGVDPVVVGLVMGLLDLRVSRRRAPTSSARPSSSASSASSRRRSSRGRRASASTSAISPNERLQQLYHPWTSYVIVPLFALANAGIAINGGFLARAFTSPITLGILVGYVVGKPVGHRRRRVARDAADAAGGCGRRSAGSPSPAAARSPASASPSRS